MQQQSPPRCSVLSLHLSSVANYSRAEISWTLWRCYPRHYLAPSSA
jgi:hypothetical protein